MLHYWRTNPEAANLTAEGIVELHTSVCRVLSPAIEAVIANHVAERTPIILEGDYLLPELLARTARERVSGVWLYEPDAAQITRNYALREPPVGPGTRELAVWKLVKGRMPAIRLDRVAFPTVGHYD